MSPHLQREIKKLVNNLLRSNTKNLLQIPLTNLKAFCAYAPRLWNELPDNIKAAESVQNFKKQLKTFAISKGVYLTTWTMTTVH